MQDHFRGIRFCSMTTDVLLVIRRDYENRNSRFQAAQVGVLGWHRAFFSFLGTGAIGSSPAQAVDVDDLVNAVDISHWSGTVTDGEVACWRESNFTHVIAGTQNPDITVQQLQTAVNRGMTVDAYVMLYWDYDIAAQVRNALATIAGFPVGRLWLDAEQPSGGRSAAQLIQKIQQAVEACGSVPCGIYTRKGWWLENMGEKRTLFRICPSGMPITIITAILTIGTTPSTGMRGRSAVGRIPPANSMTPIGRPRISAG